MPVQRAGPPVIALLTDFGLQDTYVGVMKAVIAGICPSANVIDLTHEIRPQQVSQGAFALANAVRYLPPGAIVVAVVDPGVGTSRRAIAIEVEGRILIGPDNGLLSLVLADQPGAEWRAVELSGPAFRLPKMSATFHGRDVFAPAAAHLACGARLDQLGPAVTDLVTESWPLAAKSDTEISGEVISIDRFGNMISSIGRLSWRGDALELNEAFAQAHFGPRLLPCAPQVYAEGRLIGPVRRTYGDAPAGGLLALIGSDGFLEIAVNGGSAADRIVTGIGQTITLLLSE